MAMNPTFQISEIHLLESQFKRKENIDFNTLSIKNKVSIETGHHYHESTNTLDITVLLNFSAGIGSQKFISSKIKMIGYFSCGEGAELSVDQFALANGPAIMFPFLREHLASTSLKSGIRPIILPAVNFIKLRAENKIKKITSK